MSTGSPEANKALSKARIQLMSKEDTTFFSAVCLSLVHEWNNNIPTAATDGLRIMYNEKFFMDCAPAERVGLMLHEVLHVVFTHMLRRGDRNPKKFNRAADYAINLIIDKAGFKLPQGGLLDYQYDGMSAEQIYELLDDEEDDNCWDDLIEGVGNPQDVQSQVDDIVMSAAQQAQAAGDKPGSIPAEIERRLERLRNPQVPWTAILRGFFTKLAKVDYSFRKPNRRFFPQGILMPTMTGEKLEKGAVAVDTSGSVDQHMFNEFVSETANIIRGQEPEVLHFLQFDTRVVARDDIETIRDLTKIKLKGGGGTHIDPVMQWAKDENPNWLIVFTDGYYSDPQIKPKCPVIWVIYDNPKYKAPFGKTIHYTVREEQAA
jgi:predicted metal-dependent peptidase